MSLLKYVAPAVVLASGAYAQCSTSGTLTLTNSADASSLASCQTYSGSIAVATGATEISIPVTRVTENLVTVPNGQLTSFSAPSLRQVDGQLTITQQANIGTLSMPSLIEANVMELSALGQNLLNLDFGSSGLTQVSNLTIADTFLQSLTGVNLMTAQDVLIATNSLLASLDMNIRNVSGTLAIRGNTNGNGLTVNFPDLTNAGSVLINDCSMVSMPKLTNVTNVVAFADDTFTSLSLPRLTQIGPSGGGFNIQDCSSLTNLTVPELARVAGGVVVVNNTGLSGTIAFPSLRLVGSGRFIGDYMSVTMPELDRMQGTLQLQSSKNIQSVCSGFSSGGNIGGKVQCKSAVSTTSSSSSMPTSTGSKSAAVHYEASPEKAFTIFGGLAALFALFM